jgi:beta-galactosidase
MKFKILACGLGAAIALNNTTTAKADTPYYADLNVLAVNKLAPHAARLAESNAAYTQSLDGTWQFFYSDDHRTLPALDKIKFNSTIKVPGNWERQGFGTAIYVNQQYEFKSYRPQPPLLPDAIPVGVYKRTINIPKNWDGRDIVLHIGASKSGTTVYVNGKEVGYSEDSKNPAEYLLNEYLQPGDNELVLKIMRWSTGSYLECQDFWRISGIERSVELYALPKVRVADYAVISNLDDSYTNGRFELKLKVQNNSKGKANLPVTYTLTDNNGNVVTTQTEKVKVGVGETIDANFSATIDNVKKWSAETPNLYNLTITCGDDVTKCKVGFRRIEFTNIEAHNRSNRVLLFNGKPIKFKGVNMHEHNAETGHYVSREDILHDLRLMKENNINAIRCCHYPQSDMFYDLCDSVGIYVYDEANIESHGMGYDLRKGGTLGNNPDWYAAHLDRTRNMFERNKNHASVTIWSLGNEAGNGCNFYETYKWTKAADADLMARPVVYERAVWEWNTDMFVPQYPDANWLRNAGKNGTDRPVVMSEYAHAMGNSTGGIARQWDAINSYINLQGGFIWDWIDQGFSETDEQGHKYYTYGGDYGKLQPNSGNFNCNGIINPDRTPHPGMTEVKYAYQNVGFELGENGVITLTNRNYFTDIDDGYTVACTVVEDGQVKGMQFYSVNIAPQQTATITAPSVPTGKDGLINVVVLRKSDHQNIAGEQFQVTAPEFNIDNANAQGAKLALNTKDSETITVSSDDVKFVVNRKNGTVTDYSVKGTSYVADNFGPRANYWRGPNDNDYGFGNANRAQAWKEASVPGEAKVTAKMQGDAAVITVVRTLPTTCTSTIVYTVYSDGALRIDTDLSAAESKIAAMPRNGLRMRLPQTMNKVKYYGRGPGENYSDRNRSTFVDNYSTTAEDMYYEYVRPQENGHRTDVRRLTITDAAGCGLEITADGLFEFNALRNSVEDFDGEEAVNRDYQWYDTDPNELKHDVNNAKNKRARRTHLNDITAQPYVEVCLDEAMQGVGGYDSWGAWPDDDRMVKADQPRHRSFLLRPVHK